MLDNGGGFECWQDLWSLKTALHKYDVAGIDTLISDITPPESLMKTQTERKLAEECRKTYELQEAAEKQRQQLARRHSKPSRQR